ncbi:phosphotransferase [Paraferrimonas sp. SM1919]|uniref:phosphotransferase n=1 Tax=Paraferrimonas sp. SM1919 TaxID=2662263 RepID=UPI0013D5AEF6|nr:phosphotransferase [Paraferrimonas sp. SM1919]
MINDKDAALEVWFNELQSEISSLGFGFKNVYFYYMPIFKRYVSTSISLRQYFKLTKEKRTGSYNFLRSLLVLSEFFLFKMKSKLGIRNGCISLRCPADLICIFFGNHRVRLSNKNLDSDLIVDLTPGTPIYNNSTLCSCNSDIFISPKVVSLKENNRVIKEERLSGIALNRFDISVNFKVEADFVSSLLKNIRSSSDKKLYSSYRDLYVDKCSEFINMLSFNHNYNEDIVNDFRFYSDKLLSVLDKQKIKYVNVLDSHRDLNRGNVLIMDDGELAIIDTEFYGPAYAFYDIFILLSDYRHNQNINESIKNVKCRLDFYDENLRFESILLILLEEVFFLIDNFSIRDDKNLRDISILCKTISEVLK